MKQKVEVNTSVLVFCLDYCDSMLRVRDMFLISQKHSMRLILVFLKGLRQEHGSSSGHEAVIVTESRLPSRCGVAGSGARLRFCAHPFQLLPFML